MCRLILFFLFLLQTPAYASILLEPYVGASINGEANQSTNFTNGNTATWSGKVLGMGYGARLGFMSDFGFFMGAEYAQSMDRKIIMGTNDNTSFNGPESKAYTAEIDQVDLGLFVGLSLIHFIKIWGTYYLSSTATVNSNAIPDAWASENQEWKGSGYSAGVGIYILGPIAVNLEYRSYDFDPVTPPGPSYSYEANLETSEYFVSLSFPFTF